MKRRVYFIIEKTTTPKKKNFFFFISWFAAIKTLSANSGGRCDFLSSLVIAAAAASENLIEGKGVELPVDPLAARQLATDQLLLGKETDGRLIPPSGARSIRMARQRPTLHVDDSLELCCARILTVAGFLHAFLQVAQNDPWRKLVRLQVTMAGGEEDVRQRPAVAQQTDALTAWNVPKPRISIVRTLPINQITGYVL